MSALSLSGEALEAQTENLSNMPLTDVLRWCWNTFGTLAAVGTSFQGAGLVLLHHAVQAGLPFPVFTLDTGLLFPETLETKSRLEAFFGIQIESLVPQLSVEQQAVEFGSELWKRNPDTCCQLRKVEPLKERLSTLSVWITGVRSEQGATRKKTAILERYMFDPLLERHLFKLNPMVNWKREAVWEYLRAHGVPYNPLQDRGYRSIGCQPCTRLAGEADDERAGRWAGFDKTECGIHTFLPVAR
jgi:phosphoadenosine phosphosulfate reductase